MKKHLKICPLCLGKGKIVDRHHYPLKVRNKARRLYAKGLSLRKIGEKIGVNHPQKVKSLLKSKI